MVRQATAVHFAEEDEATERKTEFWTTVTLATLILILILTLILILVLL